MEKRKIHPATAVPVTLKVIPSLENLPKILFWGGILFFVAVFFIVFSDILLPFAAGLILAYFLNPLVEFLERSGFSRFWATVMIVFFTVFICVLGLVIFVPILSEQLLNFMKNIPAYFSRVQALFADQEARWLQEYIGYIGIDMLTLQGSLNSFISQIADLMKSILPPLWHSGKALMNVVTLCIVTPVVAFYILLDWNRMVASIDSWVPRNHLETIRGLFLQMNYAVAGFIRGQGTVCLVLGGYYSVMLTACGLNFSLLIGFFVGMITFVPYIGSAIGLIIAVGLSWMQYYRWLWIVVIICIFFVGQFLEVYVLQPKLVGSSVGLHPVWLIFALFAFGRLFGFPGMLIAVPAAAVVGVLLRFALHRYLASSLYDSSSVLTENHG
ncbi:MAG: member of the PurR regulon [Candidatus Tokpelaia sp. JSC085]|nr:MAG: member of the PurR regulon [Candidatus Tokpelaia sp. JSC085]